MHITRVDLWPKTMKLGEPYAIAYDFYDVAINVFLRIETSSGLVGLGCAGPDEHVTGETPDAIVQKGREVLPAALERADPLRRERLYAEMADALAEWPSLRAALDMALLDLNGKAAGLPLWKMLGGFRESIPTFITIGILSEKETLERCESRVEEGFGLLKLKGGKDVESDIRRMHAVRRMVGGRVGIAVDANQGYTFEAALHFARETAGAGVLFLEQPVAADDVDGLRRLSFESPVPIMADEAMLDAADALRLLDGRAPLLGNIKLMKCGGPGHGMAVDAVFAAAGRKTMIGCMDESALSIAAGLHLALARPNIVYADLDGHLGLHDDPAAGAVTVEDGQVFPTEYPGLGIRDIV